MSNSSPSAAPAPRDTYLLIARALRAAIEQSVYTEQMPRVRDLAKAHGVSRSVIHRSLRVLRDEGLIESVQGVAWYVAGSGDRRPLDIRLRELINANDYRPGDRFPGEIGLSRQLGVSRISIRSALARLEGEGLISAATPQGRTILAISTDKEAS